jgi:polar amino acid transport system permease protein
VAGSSGADSGDAHLENPLLSNIARTYIELFQGTPLLMQLFLVFFGVALAGVEISPWAAAAIA